MTPHLSQGLGLHRRGPSSTLVSEIAQVKAFIAINQVAALSEVSDNATMPVLSMRHRLRC